MPESSGFRSTIGSETNTVRPVAIYPKGRNKRRFSLWLNLLLLVGSQADMATGRTVFVTLPDGGGTTKLIRSCYTEFVLTSDTDIG